MPNYTVKQGDCIENIAFKHGLFWEKVWNHPKNLNLKEKRKDPNVLYPGDVVFIPDKEEKQESGATEQKHRFRRKGVPAKIEIRLLQYGEPRKTTDFILNIDGNLIREKTNKDGWLKCKISPNARKGHLIVDPGEFQEEYDLNLGDVDPIDEISGIQGRLANLDYECKITGILNDEIKAAIALFQKDHGLDVTGEIDIKTKEEIQKTHVS